MYNPCESILILWIEVEGSGISCSDWSFWRFQIWITPDWSPTTSSCINTIDTSFTILQWPNLLVGVQADTIYWGISLENPLTRQVPHFEIPDPCWAIFSACVHPPTIFLNHQLLDTVSKHCNCPRPLAFVMRIAGEVNNHNLLLLGPLLGYPGN